MVAKVINHQFIIIAVIKCTSITTIRGQLMIGEKIAYAHQSTSFDVIIHTTINSITPSSNYIMIGSSPIQRPAKDSPADHGSN